METIKPQELRLNNLVTIDNPNHWPHLKDIPLTVTAIELVSDSVFPNSSGSVSLVGENRSSYNQFSEFLKGIDITPDWLERFGFEKHVSFNIFTKSWDCVDLLTTKLFVCMDYAPPRIEIGSKQSGFVCSRFEIQYVHQLQNLYFALTGQELTPNIA